MNARSPHYRLVPGAPLDGARRLLPVSVDLIVVDALTPPRASPSLRTRMGPLLFEAHRALKAGGTLLWACPRDRFASLLPLALGYGFAVHAPTIARCEGPGGFDGLLCPLTRVGGAVTPLQPLPAMITIMAEFEQTDEGAAPDPASTFWVSTLANWGTPPEDSWLVEIGAAQPSLAAACLAGGWSWLGVGLGEARAHQHWAPRLEAAGAREASVVTAILTEEEHISIPELVRARGGRARVAETNAPLPGLEDLGGRRARGQAVLGHATP